MLDFMLQRFGWTEGETLDLAEHTYHNLTSVWRAEAEAIRMRTPGPDGKTPAPEPDGHTSLRDLARAQGFLVPEDVTEN